MKSEILRRTFKAKEYPKGSEEREKLNLDPVTSEYMTSYKYVVKTPCLMSDGTPKPGQHNNYRTCRSKQEAVLIQEQEG